MFYREFPPSLILQNYVDRYWIIETSSKDVYPMEHTLTPNGLDALVFQYIETPQIYRQAGISKVLPANYIFIQPHKSWKLIMPGISGAVGVFFKPGALRSVFPYSMHELSGKPIELETLTGNWFKNISDQLPELELSKKVQFLEEFLIRYIKAGRINTMCCSDKAVNIIVRQKGCLTIEQLAGQVNVSRQFLSRQFSEKIGISPKHFARIIRFNALHRFLTSQPKTHWTDVTYSFGYFDQSHFIKDFIEFMGMLPTEYLVLPTEMADFNAGKVY